MADFVGVDVLVRPVHLGHMYQPFDAFFKFHERAVVGDIGNFAEDPRFLRIPSRNVRPRILT